MIRIHQLKHKYLQRKFFKNQLTICCLQEIHFKHNSISKLKVQEWEKMHHDNINKKNQEWL